jgi:NADH-quinone oxidoreductase subunit L
VIALLAWFAGALQIPKVNHVLETFLDPTFHDVHHEAPGDGLLWFGLLLGAALGLLGIFIAHHVWVRNPGLSARVQERFAPVHRLFANKWYFDELIDLTVVRPFGWLGRFGQQTFERVVVSGTLVGGTTGLVRAGSAAVRALQTGLLRSYAALLLLGTAGVALYFLVQS